MPQLHIQLLGPLQVMLDDAPLSFRYGKVRALLAYLAAEAQRPHPRLAIASLLWPEVPEATARRDLSQALFQLRETLGDLSSTLFEITRDTLQFNPGDKTTDLITFDRLLATCAAHPHDRIETCESCVVRLQQAAELYHGDFLEHFHIDDSLAFEEWLLFRREELHRQALTVLSQLTIYHARCGALADVLQYAQRQLQLEPWREEAHRQVMQALADSGQRTAAFRQYEACRKILLDELGVEPAPETTALYEHLKQSTDAGISANSITQAPRRRVTLPAQLTPFLGRAQELEQLAQLLSNPECRLITLIGPGGIGKTRLAMQAASRQQGQFSDGAALVSLAPLTDREQVITAIADALGLVLYIAGDRARQLIHFLQDRTVLLVLDNFEHLLTDAANAALIGDLLRGAPSLRLLVTSREPLNVVGEWVFEVSGLADAAVMLFAQSARRTRAGFELRPEDEPHVARICQLVGESPLAIELAAAWVRVLSCAEIAAEIERGFEFLATTARDVPERHRSLLAVFDHSWQLLSTEEQQVLRQLAVFRGGFTREAAEAVAGASLSRLSALVSKSLLRRTATGRYDLHELVRQFALSRLNAAPDEVAQVFDRHSSYFANLLAQRGPALKSAERQSSVAELISELDNLRLSWNWAASHQRATELSQAADTLFWLYESRCNCREGVPLFGQAVHGLQVVSNGTWPQRLALGQVLSYQGHFCFRQGQHPQARELLQRSLILLQTPSDEQPPAELHPTLEFARSNTLVFLGMVTTMMGDYAEGRRLSRESLAQKRALHDQWGIVLCLRELGLAAYQQGDYDEAHQLLSESHALSRELGNPWAIAFSLNCLSMAAYAQGRFSEAQQQLEEGLAISRSLDDRYNIAFALDGLGRVKQAQGDDNAAAQLFTSSIALSREIGDQASVAQGLVNRGHTLLAMDDSDGARRCFQEALIIAQEMQLTPVMLDALVGLAHLRAAAGETFTALAWLQTIIQHSAVRRDTRERAEQQLAILQTNLNFEALMPDPVTSWSLEQIVKASSRS